jgi:hypothetical protein
MWQRKLLCEGQTQFERYDSSERKNRPITTADQRLILILEAVFQALF